MAAWYYLKHRKAVPYGVDILTDPMGFIKLSNKQCYGTQKYASHIRRNFIGEYHISTIFLGLDHQHGKGEPLLFETMIFKGDSMSDNYCERCTTHRQALKQHQRVMAKLIEHIK